MMTVTRDLAVFIALIRTFLLIMRDVRLGSQRDLWWDWAIAELDSARFGAGLSSFMTVELQTKVRAGERDALTQSDWDSLKDAVTNFRKPILLDLLRFPTIWYQGELDSSDLPGVRIMNYERHVKIAPSRTLSDFAAALDAGRNSGENDFGGNYRKVRAAFRVDRIRGRPILVGEAKSGPFILLEGYTRMTVMTSLSREGKFSSQPIPVLFGVCRRLKEWYLYDLSNGRLVRTQSLY
jgi:hypothetical protein